MHRCRLLKVEHGFCRLRGSTTTEFLLEAKLYNLYALLVRVENDNLFQLKFMGNLRSIQRR